MNTEYDNYMHLAHISSTYSTDTPGIEHTKAQFHKLKSSTIVDTWWKAAK